MLFFVLFAFGVGFAVPVQDLPDTAYDESEGEPFELTPQLPHCMLLCEESVIDMVVGTVRSPVLDAPEPVPKCDRQTGAFGSTCSRLALALLCSLIC